MLEKVKRICKKYKTEIIIGVSAIVVAVGAYWIAENPDVIKDLFKGGAKAKAIAAPPVPAAVAAPVVELPVATRTVDVRRHIRNLPPTWRASAGKVAEAIANNIELEPHQTYVDPHTRSCA